MDHFKDCLYDVMVHAIMDHAAVIWTMFVSRVLEGRLYACGFHLGAHHVDHVQTV